MSGHVSLFVPFRLPYGYVYAGVVTHGSTQVPPLPDVEGILTFSKGKVKQNPVTHEGIDKCTRFTSSH